MSAWRRRTLYRAGPDGRVAELAHSAVSDGPLYAVWRVRGLPGGERIVARLSGLGRGIGPWEDTCLDLSTGEELVISSEDADVEARRLTVADFPPALAAVWPRGSNGKLIPPGASASGNGTEIGPARLRKLAGKVDLTPAQPALF